MDIEQNTVTVTDIEAKLERLNELENKFEKLKVSNRQRVGNFLAKKKQAGMIQVSALISKQAYEVINSRREKSIKAGRQTETSSSIIEQALLFMDSNFKDNININDNIKQDKTELKAVTNNLLVEPAAPIPAPPEHINLFNEPQKQEPQAAEIPAPEPLSTVQVEPQATIEAEPAAAPEPEPKAQATPIDIITMPDKAIDKAGFKTWLFTHIKALKQAGIRYIQIAEILNKAGVKTAHNKEFNNKSIEKFFNTYK